MWVDGSLVKQYKSRTQIHCIIIISLLTELNVNNYCSSNDHSIKLEIMQPNKYMNGIQANDNGPNVLNEVELKVKKI